MKICLFGIPYPEKYSLKIKVGYKLILEKRKERIHHQLAKI
jgi:hypothetical protein